MILYPFQTIGLAQLPSKYKHRATSAPSIPPQDVLMDTSTMNDVVMSSLLQPQSNLLTHPELPASGLHLKETLANFEINMIKQALERQDGVVSRAAALLGMRRTTLVEKIRKYGLVTGELKDKELA